MAIKDLYKYRLRINRCYKELRKLSVYKSDTAMDGIFRGYFVAVNETARISQVFIPTLHRKLMPFKDCDPKSGLIEGIDLKEYPLAMFCCPGVFVTPEVGDTAWIAFENGDPRFPVVIGQIGTALSEGDVVTEIYGGGTGSETIFTAGSVTGGGNKAAEEFIKIMNAGYAYGRGANQHDCSSSTCEALYLAGILPNNGKSYTTRSFGSKGEKFLEYGFIDVTKEVWPTGDKSSYSNMQPGDILWCYDAHMTMYVGDGKIGLMSSAKGCRLGNYYTDSRITNVFRYSGGSSK